MYIPILKPFSFSLWVNPIVSVVRVHNINSYNCRIYAGASLHNMQVISIDWTQKELVREPNLKQWILLCNQRRCS